MKKFMLFFYVLFCATSLFIAHSAFSQNYAEVAKYYPNKFESVNGVMLSDFQYEKAKNAYSQFYEKITETRKEFLFPDDEQLEINNHQKNYYNDLSKILSAEQMDALEAHYETIKNSRLEESAIRILEQYDYLDLTMEQAHAIALGYDSLQMIRFYGDDDRQAVLRKYLSEEQRDKLDSFEEEKMPEIEMSEENKTILEEQRRRKVEKMKAMKPVIVSFLKIMKEFYIPERALVRGKLEKEIFANEKIAIDELRELYANYFEENLKVSDQWAKMHQIDDPEYNELFELRQEGRLLMEKELFDGKGGHTVYRVLCNGRSAFYMARELAIKFDKQIDLLQKDIDLLEAGMMERIAVNMPGKYKEEMNAEIKDQKRHLAKKKYTTPEIEYRRNIAFLLVKGIEGLEDEINSERGLHSLHVYPVPALGQQTVSFEIKTSGHTIVEIISQDGKLLRNIFSGKLEAGEYNMDAEINNIQTDIFFYRVSGKDGVSIAKSMKG